MRILLIAGLGLVLGACNCGPVATTDAGTSVDSGTFDAGVDAGPSRVAYKIGEVTGTYTGNGVYVVSAIRTDILAPATCTYIGVTDAGLIVGVDGGTTMIQVSGASNCPPRSATAIGPDGGNAAAPCTTGTLDVTAALFQGTIEMTGWADDSVVTFKIVAPPSGIPGCNNASVVVAAAQPWGIEGKTTAGTFKKLQPFDVRFKGPADGGTKVLISGTNTSNVSWDFTMHVVPSLP